MLMLDLGMLILWFFFALGVAPLHQAQEVKNQLFCTPLVLKSFFYHILAHKGRNKLGSTSLWWQRSDPTSWHACMGQIITHRWVTSCMGHVISHLCVTSCMGHVIITHGHVTSCMACYVMHDMCHEYARCNLIQVVGHEWLMTWSQALGLKEINNIRDMRANLGVLEDEAQLFSPLQTQIAFAHS